MSGLGKIARRTFLLGSVAVAGGVAFGYWKYRQPYDNPLLDELADGEAALTPYVKISADGITLFSPRSEMGQGVLTTLAALVAEELDVGLDQVTVEHAPAGFAYYNSSVVEEVLPFASYDDGLMAETMRGAVGVAAKMLLARQSTGGSSSARDGYEKLRLAGAAARSALISAAAQKLGVDEGALTTARGVVTAPDGRAVAYTELAALAAEIDPSTSPKLKPRSAWNLLGASLDRVDMVEKCAGVAEFGIDTRLDGMLYAAVRMNPRLGGGMKSFDASAAETMRGVKKIVPLDGGVAVVATNTWYAFEAAKAIRFDWGEAPYPKTIEEHFAEVEASFTEERENSRHRDDGDVDAALPADAPVMEYRAPYLAHATMEPLNATVLVTDDGLDIWTGTQNPTRCRDLGAELTGFAIDDVRVHTRYLGGGFGRRSEIDYVRIAVDVAKAMKGAPVKTTLSREQDMCNDYYRPIAMGRIRGAVKDGRIAVLDVRVAAPPAGEGIAIRANLPVSGPDPTIVQSTFDQPYEAPDYRTIGYRVPTMLPVGAWRSVGSSQNAFFHESAIDELAVSAGIDPIELRLNSISHPPSRKVIEAVAEMSSWGGETPAGHGFGVAYSLSFGVPTAEVIEVAETEDGLKVLNVWAAVDVGVALDPRNIEAQVISGVNFGLSAAMLNEVTLRDGEVRETNFHSYEAMRIYQAPNIEVRVLEVADDIRGIGEPGTPPAAPALANAIFAATGERLREMPFGKFVTFA
ncbi:MAG: molybdopterin cofactor-binding domain-containing protein [Pseudomonadota bacterium]